MDEPTQGGENRELLDVQKMMDEPVISEASGLVLAAWKLYWLARANMISVSGGRITDKNFSIISEALAKSACRGFKIGKFKNQVKKSVVPFLQRLSAREARLSDEEETKHDQPQ